MLDIQVWGFLFVTRSYSRKLDSWTFVPKAVLVYTEQKLMFPLFVL